ncbi:hypothetical protein JCM10207_003055 [Rhodosporidiobolus poonsookiae]
MSTPAPADDARLSRNVLPTHYDLAIRTDLQNCTFSGTVEILIDVAEPSQTLTLHARVPLEVQAAVLGGQHVKNRRATHFHADKEKQRLTLSFEGGEIAAGQHKVGLRWTCPLDDSLGGYYRSSFPKKDGSGKVYYSLTQFEPCMARRAFPCFDEPDMKATFSMSLISRVGTVSLANMDVKSTEHLGAGGDFTRTSLLDEAFFAEQQVQITYVGDDTEERKATKPDAAAVESVASGNDGFKDDWEIVHYHPTPTMSTYLAAFANGDFEYIESSFTSPLTGQNIPLRMYATYDHIAQAKLTLQTSVEILPLYEKIFDIPYPLPKLDTLVVGDFAGAMENWGLIIGQTKVYLYDPQSSGVSVKKMVVTVQSHEIAHQWFGNIVTMEWWDNLWLNESFATLMGEVIIPDRIEPGWKLHAAFISQHLARALQLDSLRSSHPIEMPCPDEGTIQQIFDALTYSKGGSCLKMLSNWVGEAAFLRGVSNYLKAHLYGNAQTADLLKGISEASGRDTESLMKNWLGKTGFPLIEVEETKEGLKVSQRRFLSTGDATPEEDQTIWHVPLQLLVVGKDGKKEVKSDLVLTRKEMTIDLPGVEGATYKLNAETCGVYRTLYSTSRLSKIGDEAGKPDSAFSLADRMGLVQDAASLASAGYARTSDSLTLLSKMTGETENLVWQEISTALDDLASAWWDQPQAVRDAISQFRRELFVPLVDKLGWEYKDGEESDVVELRTVAIATAAVCGDEKTLAEYKRRFGLFTEKNDDSLIPGDLMSSIYSQSVRFGGEREYEKVLEVYHAAASPAHVTAGYTALCSAEDPVLLQRTFDMLLSPDVKTQDIHFFLRKLSENYAARRKLWEWVQAKYDELMRRLAGNTLVPAMLKAALSTLSSPADADAIESFFAAKDAKERAMWGQAVDQAVDTVRSRAKWIERDAEDVEGWLRGRGHLE